MAQREVPIQSIGQISEIISQIKLEWNDLFLPNVNPNSYQFRSLMQ